MGKPPAPRAKPLAPQTFSSSLTIPDASTISTPSSSRERRHHSHHRETLAPPPSTFDLRRTAHLLEKLTPSLDSPHLPEQNPSINLSFRQPSTETATSRLAPPSSPARPSPENLQNMDFESPRPALPEIKVKSLFRALMISNGEDNHDQQRRNLLLPSTLIGLAFLSGSNDY